MLVKDVCSMLTVRKGHVNNVMYNRYAESARVNWTLNFAASDPAHKTEWLELVSPKSIGLILRSIKTDYKFVSVPCHPVGSVRRRVSRAVHLKRLC